MNRNKTYTVWRNDDYSTENFEDWKNGYIEHLEMNDREIPETIDDGDVYEYMAETEALYFEDECRNLGKIGKDSPGFLLVADIGRWDGRRFGYAEANTMEDALRKSIGSCDYANIFVKGGKLKTKATHHDGTNYVEIRAWKPDVSCDTMERVKDAIYDNQPNAWNLINRHTRGLGKEIAQVYGW